MNGAHATSDPFEPLTSACLECGRLVPSESCPVCRTPATGSEPGPKLVGARIRPKPGRPAPTVVAAYGVMLDTVLDDGSITSVSRFGLGSDGVFLMPAVPAPEQLFAAAFRWQIPDPAAEKVLGKAIGMAQQASRRVQLRVAELGYAMERPDLADPLAIPPSTRSWFEAQSLTRKGELDEAGRLLVQLPPASSPRVSASGPWRRRRCLSRFASRSTARSTRSRAAARSPTRPLRWCASPWLPPPGTRLRSRLRSDGDW